MAGRGRGATLPAWMTSDISQTTDPGISNYPGQFEDDVRQTNPFEYNAPDRRGNGERPDRYERGDRRGSDGRERKRSRSSDRRPRRSE